MNTMLMKIAVQLVLVLISTSALATQITGAIYTTLFDGSSVNANLYDAKADVYLNGGSAGNKNLRPGNYYFQVTDPSGATLLSTDPAVCRQVTVNTSGLISAYIAVAGCAPGHLTWTNSTTHGMTVQLLPYADTPNNGGEYKAWLISEEEGVVPDTIGCGLSAVYPDSLNPAQLHFPASCAKTDNFKIRSQDTCQIECQSGFLISGTKFYDANDSTLRDNGEAGIQYFQIQIIVDGNNANPITVVTDSNGYWEYSPLSAGQTYTACEILPGTNPDGSFWLQTAPVPDSQGKSCYSGTIANHDVTGLDFGNLCLGNASGGLTLGFWKSKNGQAAIAANCSTAFTALLPGLNLATGSCTLNQENFDPTTYTALKNWMSNATAVNMAYMLSVQLATTELDVCVHALDPAQLVLTQTLGVKSIGDIMILTNGTAALGSTLPDGKCTTKHTILRDYEQNLEATLDAINNNQLPFVRPGACAVTYPQ